MIFAVIRNGRNIKGKQFTAGYIGVYRVTGWCTGQKKTQHMRYTSGKFVWLNLSLQLILIHLILNTRLWGSLTSLILKPYNSKVSLTLFAPVTLKAWFNVLILLYWGCTFRVWYCCCVPHCILPLLYLNPAHFNAKHLLCGALFLTCCVKIEHS